MNRDYVSALEWFSLAHCGFCSVIRYPGATLWNIENGIKIDTAEKSEMKKAIKFYSYCFS